jgi:hypothetical protein
VKFIFLVPDEFASTNPTIVSLARALSSDGFDIDVFIPGGSEPLISEKNKGKIKYFRYEFSAHDSRAYIMTRIKARLGIGKDKRAIIIAFYQRGVIDAYEYSKLLNIPFINFPFEFVFNDELDSDSLREVKQKEIEAGRHAAFTVFPDRVRGDIYTLENGLEGHEVFYMPVSPSTTPEIEESNYLMEKFKIPEDKTIVIHSGSFAEWTSAPELIDSAAEWPDDFVLVVHLRNQPNDYIKGLMEKAPTKNVIFSTIPLDDLTYSKLVASADIGIATYRPTYEDYYLGKNVESIGLSSGKFSYYMKCALPTVSVKQGYFRELLKEYSFGVDVDGFEDFPEALTHIKEDRDLYSGEARRLFDEKLNFDLFYPAFKERLMRIFASQAEN